MTSSPTATRTRTLPSIDLRHHDDGSVGVTYRGKSATCADGVVSCAVGRAVHWAETGDRLALEQCLHEPHTDA